MSEINKGDFKKTDSESYDEVSDQYDRFVGLFSAKLPARLIELANIKQADKVLDVGTGSGIVALEVSRQLGKEGNVVGIDLSEGMLTTARTQAKQLGLNNIEFKSMDAERLDYEDNSFDSLVSLYALRHFPHPDLALKEMYRVLRPGGKMAIAVGSSPSLSTLDGWIAGGRHAYSLGLQIMGKRLIACNYLDLLIDKHLPKPTELEITQWSNEHSHFTGSVVSLTESVGFKSVKSEWLGQQAIIETVDDFWDIQITFSSKARKRMATASESNFGLIKDEFTKNCQKVMSRGGTLVYPTGTLFVHGVRP